ncbi:hypothetical protein M427DRAFT_402362 [Gonapodya prolifera JEL478]|uniref:Uncharacterized protein n=1 Tax=Gonapodya prolifera (strain JEL478) TaxID=1344416 RepID=A0A139ATQ2_GONPJ|nr:hypothetical protein M427DRAFT_402362 [Gonapodya prolifera JEL478]|eukprot:KXS20108.1 hypothetical protein M427DRAFT_402362 [Gonapodya prolifera JEL478]
MCPAPSLENLEQSIVWIFGVSWRRHRCGTWKSEIERLWGRDDWGTEGLGIGPKIDRGFTPVLFARLAAVLLHTQLFEQSKGCNNICRKRREYKEGGAPRSLFSSSQEAPAGPVPAFQLRNTWDQLQDMLRSLEDSEKMCEDILDNCSDPFWIVPYLEKVVAGTTLTGAITFCTDLAGVSNITASPNPSQASQNASTNTTVLGSAVLPPAPNVPTQPATEPPPVTPNSHLVRTVCPHWTLPIPLP